MTLDRADILTKTRIRSKANTVLVNGYINRSINSKKIFVSALYYNGLRLKGYFDITDLQKLIDGKKPTT